MEVRSVTQFLEYWDSLRSRTRRVVTCIPPERLEWTHRAGAFAAPPLFGLTSEEVRARSG